MVVLRDSDIDFASWFEIRRGQFGGLVVTLGAPGNIVGVAEGIHVKNVDVRRRHEEVLDEAGEKMPWIEEKEGDDEPQYVCGQERDDEIAKEGVVNEVGDIEGVRWSGVDLNGANGDEDRSKD